MTERNITIYCVLIIFLFANYGCIEKSGKTEPDSKNKFIDTVLNYRLNKLSFTMPEKLKENSGLIYYRDVLWTMEDAGGKPKIYTINTKSGKIKQTIKLLDSENNDWEDITQDEKYIYIGDFGNNDGHKSVLRIYKISKNTIPWKGNFDVESELIEFSYPEQNDLRPRFHQTNFDCEALISKGDSLYLFTKNWIDNKTNVYSLPKEKGSYLANFCGNFDVRGLISGAGISSDEKRIILCGHQEKLPFIWYLSDFTGNNFFSGNKIRLNLTFLFGVQTEGICFMNNNNIFLSNEKSVIPSSLYTTSVEQILESIGLNIKEKI
ncbi:T9SS C-terminal target domain-containing protein [Bacteroidota bacterium]